eukprot:SAG22_NODE_76_length_22248_cov_14.352070_12_plen_471_part_00
MIPLSCYSCRAGTTSLAQAIASGAQAAAEMPGPPPMAVLKEHIFATAGLTAEDLDADVLEYMAGALAEGGDREDIAEAIGPFLVDLGCAEDEGDATALALTILDAVGAARLPDDQTVVDDVASSALDLSTTVLARQGSIEQRLRRAAADRECSLLSCDVANLEHELARTRSSVAELEMQSPAGCPGREPAPEAVSHAGKAAPRRKKRTAKGRRNSKRDAAAAAAAAAGDAVAPAATPALPAGDLDDPRVQPMFAACEAFLFAGRNGDSSHGGGGCAHQAESAPTSVRTWDAAALADFIRAYPSSEFSRGRHLRRLDVVEGLAKAVEQSQPELTADLLLISGADALRERCLAAGMRSKANLAALKSLCPRILEALRQELARDSQRQAIASGEAGYWETIASGTDEEQLMTLALDGTSIGEALQAMLELQPAEALRYCVKQCGSGDVSVTGVEEAVSWISDDPADFFKVVSV